MDPIIRAIELSTHVTLPYVEQGDASGVPVILLHGFLDSWHSFERVLPHLPESLHTFSVTLRGHGDASRSALGRSRNFHRKPHELILTRKDVACLRTEMGNPCANPCVHGCGCQPLLL